MRRFVAMLIVLVAALSLGAMCQPKPVPVPTPLDAGPMPSVDAAPPPIPTVVVDAGPKPLPTVVVDAGPPPAPFQWLDCLPTERFKALPGIKHKLGAKLNAHPRLSRAVVVRLPPKNAFFEALNPTPLDQDKPKPLGACVGFSACEELSTQPFTLASTQQRGLDLYHWATVLDNIAGTYPPDDTGSTCEAGAQAAVKLGYISGYTLVYTLAEVQAGLGVQPGVICSNWSTPQFTPDSCGLTHYDPNSIEGGHARALVGQNVTLGRVAERNTWGKWGTTRKGVSGYFQESFDDIQHELDDGGVVVFYKVP